MKRLASIRLPFRFSWLLAALAAGCDGSQGLQEAQEADSVVALRAAVVTPGTVLVDAHFAASTESFRYRDDTFRGTSQPAYASGTRLSSGGFTDGALRVRLGGIDGADILDMSGGWERSFTLAERALVTLTFRYNLIQTPDYEDDEFSQVNGSIDGRAIGAFPGTDSFVTIAGDGEGGPPRAVGWHLQSNNLGVLEAGTHTLLLGGFNNKKTAAGESSDVFIDDVRLVADPPPGPQTLLSATFDSGTQNFFYEDDTFRGTGQAAYASGAFSASGGFAGGGLLVSLGGVDGTTVLGMSGGWHSSFVVPAPAQVSVSFRYNLSMTAAYESDEFAEVNASLNGVLFGEVPGADKFVTLTGGGPGGPIGWHHPVANLGMLAPGNYIITFGGFNNKKTAANESTLVSIDDVVVTATF